MKGKSTRALFHLNHAHNINPTFNKAVMLCTCEKQKQRLIKQAKSLGLNIPDYCFVVARPYEEYQENPELFKKESFKSLKNLTKD